MTKNNKTKYIIGGITAALVVVVAVVFANPSLQKGFLNIGQLAPTKPILPEVSIIPNQNRNLTNPIARPRRTYPACQSASDFDVSVDSRWTLPDPFLLPNNPAETVIGKLILSPRNCSLPLYMLHFQWRDNSPLNHVTDHALYIIPTRISALISVAGRAIEFTAESTGEIQCRDIEDFSLVDDNLPSGILVTPEFPASIVIKSTLRSGLASDDVTPRADSIYQLRLTGVSNLYKEFSLPRYFFHYDSTPIYSRRMCGY